LPGLVEGAQLVRERRMIPAERLDVRVLAAVAGEEERLEQGVRGLGGREGGFHAGAHTRPGDRGTVTRPRGHAKEWMSFPALSPSGTIMLSSLDSFGASGRRAPPDRPPAKAPTRARLPGGIPREYGLVILEHARVLAFRWRGELLVSEILARLCDRDEEIFRALCDAHRDPGVVVRALLPALWAED